MREVLYDQSMADLRAKIALYDKKMCIMLTKEDYSTALYRREHIYRLLRITPKFR